MQRDADALPDYLDALALCPELACNSGAPEKEGAAAAAAAAAGSREGRGEARGAGSSEGLGPVCHTGLEPWTSRAPAGLLLTRASLAFGQLPEAMLELTLTPTLTLTLTLTLTSCRRQCSSEAPRPTSSCSTRRTTPSSSGAASITSRARRSRPALCYLVITPLGRGGAGPPYVT